MKTVLLLVAFSGSLFLGLRSSSNTTFNSAEDDAVFVNPAYNTVMPVVAGHFPEYQQQVSARLEYIESALQRRDVSGWPQALQAERARNIERLKEYRLAGRFPINYDHPATQLPCFYDRDGNLCAVAHLIAESDGIEAVKAINSRYQYATVQEMKMVELDEWIARSGLTREEVITIQEPGWFGGQWVEGQPTDQIQLLAVPVQMDSASTTQQVAEPVEPAQIELPHVQDPGLTQVKETPVPRPSVQ